MQGRLFDGSNDISMYVEHVEAMTRFEYDVRLRVQTDDRWILSSNLQKAIRRGLTDIAMATVARLIDVDLRYVMRRLAVIAYEDVGVSNMRLCAAALSWSNQNSAWSARTVERHAMYLVSQLCKSTKSRALCDVIAALEFAPDCKELRLRSARYSDRQLIEVSSDILNRLIDRTAALREISRRTSRVELMAKVAERLLLDDVATHLFASGHRASESMNVGIPIVVQMISRRDRSPRLRRCPFAFDGCGGIMFCALDRHTRIGTKSFQDLLAHSPKLKALPIQKGRNPVDAIGAAVFLLEGASLDQQHECTHESSFAREFELSFLGHFGIRSASAILDTKEAVRRELPRLNELRRRNLQAQFG